MTQSSDIAQPQPNSPEVSLKGQCAVVVLFSYYASDPRPRREAETLQQAGMDVEVICLREDSSEPTREVINGVRVFRLPIARRRDGKLTYILQYTAFFIAALCVVSARSLRTRYHLVHAHNMPDFLVFTGILPRLRGAKIMLDLHDPMPELLRTIYGVPENSFMVKYLKLVEKSSIAFADIVLTPNIAFRNLFISRGCPPEKIHIIMNSPRSDIFKENSEPPYSRLTGNNGQIPTGEGTPSSPALSATNDNHALEADAISSPALPPPSDRPFILMYHGLLVERHGLDLAIRAVDQVRKRIPNVRLDLYGKPTSYMEQMKKLIQQLGLESVVHFYGWISQEEIARRIQQIDLGLIPNRVTCFTQINMPTRIFEYLAERKPVIVPNTKGIRDYFDENNMLFFEPENIDSLSRKIYWVHEHREDVIAFIQKAHSVYEKHEWKFEERRFIKLAQQVA